MKLGKINLISCWIFLTQKEYLIKKLYFISRDTVSFACIFHKQCNSLWVPVSRLKDKTHYVHSWSILFCLCTENNAAIHELLPQAFFFGCESCSYRFLKRCSEEIGQKKIRDIWLLGKLSLNGLLFTSSRC